MGGPEFDPVTGRFRCVMAWRFPVSEKKHVLDGVPEVIVAEFAPLFGAIGRNKNAMAQDARDRICRVVQKAENQLGTIHALLDQCATEVHSFKLLDAGTATDRQVANLVGYLRSELEAEKLNTADMIALSNERDRLKEDNFTVREEAAALTLERDGLLRALTAKAAALKIAWEEISKQAQEIVRLKGDLSSRCRLLADAWHVLEVKGHQFEGMGILPDFNLASPADMITAIIDYWETLWESSQNDEARIVKERDDALANLEQAKASAAADLATIHGLRRARHFADAEYEALIGLAQFAGVRNIGVLMPIDLIKLSTAALKSVMTAHDEDTRKIQELQRRFADRVEWSHTIGAALDALPDAVKQALGDMTRGPECIQKLGRWAEDTLTYEARERGQQETIRALRGETGTLRQQLNDAQQRANHGRRLYEAERDHCARITAVLNDAQILTDLNEIPF